MVAYDVIGCKKPEDAFYVERIRNGIFAGGFYFCIGICKKGSFQSQQKDTIILRLTFDKNTQLQSSTFFVTGISLSENTLFEKNSPLNYSRFSKFIHRFLEYANSLAINSAMRFSDTIEGFLSAMMFVFTAHAEKLYSICISDYVRGYCPKNSDYKNTLFKRIVPKEKRRHARCGSGMYVFLSKK